MTSRAHARSAIASRYWRVLVCLCVHVTSYIVEAGLAQGTSLDNSVPVEYRYRFIHSVDHNVHNSPIDKVYRLPAPLSCVATIERGSEMLKLYRPSADPSRAQLKQMKLVRHDTAYSPHEVLTCLAIAEAAMLVTSSKQSLTGPFHISFWDADTLNLVHRVTTQTPHTVGPPQFLRVPAANCWLSSQLTLVVVVVGVGGGGGGVCVCVEPTRSCVGASARKRCFRQATVLERGPAAPS